MVVSGLWSYTSAPAQTYGRRTNRWNRRLTPASPVAAPHFALQLSVGPSVTSLTVGNVKYVSIHGHLDTFIGHELVAGPLGTEGNRIAIGFGYMGSVDANQGELLHRHGAGFSFTNNSFYVTIGGGVSLLHTFDGDFFAGAGLATSIGFRFKKFHFGLPIDLDIFSGSPATTFAFTLGYAM